MTSGARAERLSCTRAGRWLRTDPAPRFLAAGGLTFAVDIGSLDLLHGELKLPLAAATALAFGIALVLNFLAARHWTFASFARDGRVHRQLVRYLVLVLANLLSTLAIVVGLNALGVQYLIAKVLAATLNAVANFFTYKYWVFRGESHVGHGS